MRQYEFDTVTAKAVKMTPMNLLFPKAILDELRNMDIREGRCFENAVLVAKELEKKGYEIDVVEGFYKINKQTKKNYPYYNYYEDWMEHRWCKIGDYYFDATHYLDADAELKSKNFDYRAQRLYYADDLLEFARIITKDFKGITNGLLNGLWCSSLNGAAWKNDTVHYYAKINEDFNYVRCA
jgi:hypothetical protein